MENDPPEIPIGPRTHHMRRELPTGPNSYTDRDMWQTPDGPEDYSDLMEIYMRWRGYARLSHNTARQSALLTDLILMLRKYFQDKFITDTRAVASLSAMIDKLPEAYNAIHQFGAAREGGFELSDAANAQQFKRFVFERLPAGLQPRREAVPARQSYTPDEMQRFLQQLRTFQRAQLVQPQHTEHLCALLESLHSRISALEARRT
jgi:hypothetical protein